MFLNKENLLYVIWVLEEVRISLNLTNKQLCRLMQDKELIKYLTENYDELHSYGVEEGINAVIMIITGVKGKMSLNDLKSNDIVVHNMETLVLSMMFHLDKYADECYSMVLKSKEYELICNREFDDWTYSPYAWEDKIYKELGLDVEW